MNRKFADCKISGIELWYSIYVCVDLHIIDFWNSNLFKSTQCKFNSVWLAMSILTVWHSLINIPLSLLLAILEIIIYWNKRNKGNKDFFQSNSHIFLKIIKV